MKRPLEGIKVLEWGIFHAGPGGPAILADMGADVIKIEQPGVGDPVRKIIRYKDINFNLEGDKNLFFEAANRVKKSITIDLSCEKGREIAYNLARKSDVFLTNLRSSTVKSYKMDYQTLSKINPNLIYASVTSYGSRGPDGDQGGYDYQGQARSGFMFNMGETDTKPLILQFAVIDQATAIMASYQIMIALFMRERFGIAQKVEVSLLGSALYLMYLNNLTALLTGKEIPVHNQATADPQRNYYQCKDGKWIIQTQLPDSGKWKKVCEVLGHPELGKDPRYDTRDKRLDLSEELVAVFNEAFLTKTRDEWLKLFKGNGLMICPVNRTMEVMEDPQVIENEYIVDYNHPVLGEIRIPGFPIRFSQAEINTNLSAPEFGEHTESILKEVGGYSDKEIAHFKKEKVI